MSKKFLIFIGVIIALSAVVITALFLSVNKEEPVKVETELFTEVVEESSIIVETTTEVEEASDDSTIPEDWNKFTFELEDRLEVQEVETSTSDFVCTGEPRIDALVEQVLISGNFTKAVLQEDTYSPFLKAHLYFVTYDSKELYQFYLEDDGDVLYEKGDFRDYAEYTEIKE